MGQEALGRSWLPGAPPHAKTGGATLRTVQRRSAQAAHQLEGPLRLPHASGAAGHCD